MDFKMDNGVIVRVAAEDGDKKKKKGDGINAAIGLLQEMRNFQEKVQACIEAQDLEENKAKIEQILQGLEGGYQSLIDIASTGIRSMGKKPEEVIGEGESMMDKGMDAPKEESDAKKPIMLSTPSIPQISKI